MRLHANLSAVASVATLAALGLWSAAACALTISPVLVELSPARRVSSITFTNPGSMPVRYQAKVLAWSQADGVDQYADTDELMIVPPIAQVAAGGSQIFRVAVRGRPDGQEHAYRLVFEDVSDPPAPASSTDTTINIRVNHNLPAFLSAPGKPRAKPRLVACDGPPQVPIAAVTSKPGSRTECVRLDNEGSRYVQLRTLSVDAGGWRKDIGGSARVLAGSWKQWTFEVPADVTGTLQVKADTSEGPVVFELARSTR